MIPLFDSLTHPTITGTLNSLSSDFKTVENEMNMTNFKWACALGLEGIEKYDVLVNRINDTMIDMTLGVLGSLLYCIGVIVRELFKRTKKL